MLEEQRGKHVTAACISVRLKASSRVLCPIKMSKTPIWQNTKVHDGSVGKAHSVQWELAA